MYLLANCIAAARGAKYSIFESHRTVFDGAANQHNIARPQLLSELSFINIQYSCCISSIIMARTDDISDRWQDNSKIK